MSCRHVSRKLWVLSKKHAVVTRDNRACQLKFMLSVKNRAVSPTLLKNQLYHGWALNWCLIHHLLLLKKVLYFPSIAPVAWHHYIHTHTTGRFKLEFRFERFKNQHFVQKVAFYPDFQLNHDKPKPRHSFLKTKYLLRLFLINALWWNSSKPFQGAQ